MTAEKALDRAEWAHL